PAPLAAPVVATPPASVKLPPAMTSPLGMRARSYTAMVELENIVPSTPPPSGDQDAPFQRAMPRAATPPIDVNSPPTTMSPFGSASTVRSSLVEPVPSG